MTLPISLPVSRLIDVQVILTPRAAQGQNLSALLILIDNPTIDVVTRIKSYSTIDEIAAEVGTSDPAYLAAVLWFEQAPQPTQLFLGRWAKTATSGQLFCGALTAAEQLMAAWQGITTGGFLVYVDRVPHAVTGLDFHLASNLNGVAAAIQTVLSGLAAGAKVVWNSLYNRFEITSGTTDPNSAVSFLSAPHGIGHFAFSGQPSDGDKITLNGTDVIFVTGAPGPGEVKIGTSLTATLANLLAFLQASDDPQLVKFSYIVVGSTLYVVAVAPGAGGDSLTIAKTSTAITVSGATLTGGDATDISGMMNGLITSSGAYVANGIAPETALEAVTLFDNEFGQQWFALVVPEATDADHVLIANYIEAANNKHFYGVSTEEAGVLVPNDTADIAYLLQQLKLKKTCVQFSSSNPYAVVSLLGRILTTNYAGNQTVITLMYKQEPGIVAENLTETEIDALEAKNCNVFVAYNNDTAIIEPGVCSSGDFIDTVIGAMGLAVAIQTAVYNLLYTSPTKIPQTDAGIHLIVTTIALVCSQYVGNGLLGPGTWTSQGFGALEDGQFMPKGYYIFVPPVATQAQAQREARISPPIQIAAKLGGAVHKVDCMITVNS